MRINDSEASKIKQANKHYQSTKKQMLINLSHRRSDVLFERLSVFVVQLLRVVMRSLLSTHTVCGSVLEVKDKKQLEAHINSVFVFIEMDANNSTIPKHSLKENP